MAIESKRCPECNCPTDLEKIQIQEELTGRKIPGVPVLPQNVTVHHSWCPTLPHLTREEQAKLQADLDEIARCHRRAAAESRNFWIG